ncbi:MAG TPA: hypothetical protein VGM05_28720 [Planctomycetaceae bacterium]|jgi:hypothetical protein
MTDATPNRATILRQALDRAEANSEFSEAALTLRDGTRLCFCHRVGERWAKAVGPEGRETEPGLAGALLTGMAMFRLNAKHLDIQFDDGSRWEERLSPGDLI